MTPAQIAHRGHDAAADRTAPRRVLVADDSRLQRRILRALLERWGYEVDEAACGTAALALMQARAYDFVLSDWMMPGLDGLELCRAFRALSRDRYGYFILLTAKDDKAEVAEGLGNGADDFLAKPFNSAELRARIVSGERIVTMERALIEKNRLVRSTLEEISALYATVDRDLVEARNNQMTLVRERERDFVSAHVSVLLRPSGHVGGDLVGYFRLGPDKLALYAIDVSGHGVASAMLAARLAGMFTSATAGGSVAWAPVAWDQIEPLPPECAAARLNAILLKRMKVDQYFTCIYACAHLRTGQVDFVQAGHPHPLVFRADGRVESVGEGGLPVGLVEEATYERVTVQLGPGDRLLLMSDGLTEASDAEGREFGEDGVATLGLRHRSLEGPAFLEALVGGVQDFAGRQALRDDISAVLFQYRG